MTIDVNLGENSYPIHIKRGGLEIAGELIDLNRRVFIVTDKGVPADYARKILGQSKEAIISTIPSGEESKSFRCLEELLREMLRAGLSRRDCVVAVGGGVVGDLAGFAAATYMRGIDFYNIPTTVLSQVDSSVGGKTAIDLAGVKNIVGAFYQPDCVLIDPDTLDTLPARQVSNGLAEALKMSLTSDKCLFNIFNTDDPYDYVDEIIERSIRIKVGVVEKDEKESGLRRILNFGHTIGHAIESYEGLQGLLHGECIGIGMLPMCSEALRPEVEQILLKLNLPVCCPTDLDKLIEYMAHDKKADGNMITVILVERPGEHVIRSVSLDEMKERLKIFDK